MKTFTLSCSSTADLPLAYLQKRDIPFICYHYTLNGKDYPDDLGQSEPIEAFYDKIRKGGMPTTTQINQSRFIEFFEPMLRAGQDVLHLELSSGISGTYGSALAAQKELSERYPDRRLIVIDTLAASSGYGLLVDATCDLRDSGASLEEARAWVQNNKMCLHHWVFTTDLTHLKRGGRISAATATFGTLLNICPIINVDVHGKLVTRGKARGIKRAIETLAQKMQAHAQGGLAYKGRVYISNSSDMKDARALADVIAERFAQIDGKVQIYDIGTVIGAHTGPGTVALFFWGDERVD